MDICINCKHCINRYYTRYHYCNACKITNPVTGVVKLAKCSNANKYGFCPKYESLDSKSNYSLNKTHIIIAVLVILFLLLAIIGLFMNN